MPGLFSDTFLRPRGLPGRLGGWIMSRTSHRLPVEVVDALHLQPGEHVVEVGSGPGLGLATAAERVAHGSVVGIEPSTVMREQAMRRNATALDRVRVLAGTAGSLPLADASFDAALSTNSFQLWPDPERGLRELHRVLRPGGRVIIALSKYAWPPRNADIAACLSAAGFGDVRPVHPPSAKIAVAAVRR